MILLNCYHVFILNCFQILYCESSVIMNCSLKSRSLLHPLRLEVYTTLKTEICGIQSIKTNTTSMQRLIYYENVLDFDLCLGDTELSADIFVSNPNTVTSVMSLSLGNQTSKTIRLFIKEGNLLLDNKIDFLSIELNEVKLQISNNSVNTNQRHYKTLSFVDFSVINNNNYYFVNNNNEKDVPEVDATPIMDFNTLMGLIMALITLTLLVIFFCWKFQNT